jgi:uncharacterized protein YecT (DUF1311 family)
MSSRLSLVLGAAVLAAFAPTGASGATLSAPVIHESFTVLPCAGAPSARSTVQQEGCAEHMILAGDHRIDALNRAVFGKLASIGAKRRFVAAHDAWLVYRHSYCLSESDASTGGTEAPVLSAQCAVSMNSQHIANLTGFLRDLH